MPTTSQTRTVSFTCHSEGEAALLHDAAKRYRKVLAAADIDPRNYAPANAEGAGFGWDTVVNATRDMGSGTVTHMSRRIADGIRQALVHLIETTPGDHDQAVSVTNRLADLTGARRIS